MAGSDSEYEIASDDSHNSNNSHMVLDYESSSFEESDIDLGRVILYQFEPSDSDEGHWETDSLESNHENGEEQLQGQERLQNLNWYVYM